MVVELDWDKAYDVARHAATALPAGRRAVPEAVGGWLAEPVVAAASSPGFDAAAMDGYAVAGDGPWRLAGRRMAGDPGPVGRLAAGEAVEVGTGARVPEGAWAVLPYEHSRIDAHRIYGEPGKPHIRRAGEHGRAGDEIVPSGRVLTGVGAAAALQFGVEAVLVVPRPRVALLVTGDEVVLGGPAGAGRVRDVFGPLVAAVTGRAGGDIAGVRHVRDDPAALRTALGPGDADVLVVTGASSAGAADHLHAVLGAAGAEWLVDGVACRPGHPQGLAALPDGRWVVSLPGNPLAGLVAALTLLEPLVTALSGRPPAYDVRRPVTGPVREGPTRIVPVRDGAVLPGAGSADLRVAAAADALAVLEPTWTSGAPARLLQLP